MPEPDLAPAHGAPWPKIPGVTKIAVLRANALGDLVFALPAYAALEAAYPAAELVLLATPWHARFLSGRPGPVDRVEVIPVSTGLRAEPGREPDERELERFFARMRRERFDLAVQMHGGGRYSNPFLRRLGARFTVGLRTPDSEPLDRWLPYYYYQHEMLRQLEVASLAGAPPVSLEPKLELMPSDFEALEAHFDMPQAPYVVVHPGANDARRRWPVERFAAVANALARDGYLVVVTGQRAEQALLEQLEAKATAVYAVLRDLTHGALAALLSRAALVVSNDTGPAHLARAVGARTITIFWGPNVINAGAYYRARHRIAVSWQMTCPLCGCDFGHPYPYTGYDCGHRLSLLEPVPVEEVVEAARSLLGEDSSAWEAAETDAATAHLSGARIGAY